jgi:hypothetical protein
VGGLSGTQFTCFTSTKVQILTQHVGGLSGTQFTCFTSTKVQILTQHVGGLSAAHFPPEKRDPLLPSDAAAGGVLLY